MDDNIPETRIKRYQESDGSWHIILTARVLSVVPRAVFKRFMYALYEMEDSLITPTEKVTDGR